MSTKLNPHTILIVDDMPVVREALRWLLEDEQNLRVVGEAGAGLEAVQQAIQLEPEVVLLDVELPDMDGYSVARQLKALPRPPLVIFLTVHSDERARLQASAAGADGFAEKGQGWLTLVNQIRLALRSRP